MKQDLHIGNSQLAILPYNPTVSYSTPTDFSAADVLFTLEGTLNFDEGSPSTNPIRLDQKHEVIDDEFSEDQEYTMTGDIPSINLALMSYFFEEGSAVSGVKVVSPMPVRVTAQPRRRRLWSSLSPRARRPPSS